MSKQGLPRGTKDSGGGDVSIRRPRSNQVDPRVVDRFLIRQPHTIRDRSSEFNTKNSDVPQSKKGRRDEFSRVDSMHLFKYIM